MSHKAAKVAEKMVRGRFKVFEFKGVLCVFCALARDMKIWHESQKITKFPDGNLEITFQVAGLDEIKRCILRLGPEGVVLEPEKLKEMVRQDLSRNLAQYSTGPIAEKSMKEIRAI
jgi:hypothetical protein